MLQIFLLHVSHGPIGIYLLNCRHLMEIDKRGSCQLVSVETCHRSFVDRFGSILRPFYGWLVAIAHLSEETVNFKVSRHIRVSVVFVHHLPVLLLTLQEVLLLLLQDLPDGPELLPRDGLVLAISPPVLQDCQDRLHLMKIVTAIIIMR